MGATRYDTWAMRLNEAIRSRQEPQALHPARLANATTKELLLAFAEEAAAIVGAIGRNIDAVQVDGNQRIDSLPGILDALLPHRAFSLVEYRYTLPSGVQPGLRLWVDLGVDPGRVEVQRFEDIRLWRVDPSLRDDFDLPIRFVLTADGFDPKPEPELAPAFSACTDWRSALRETLALPFRHLYEPATGAN
jgi:hypothetical protein